MDLGLKDRVYIVTGATRGLGFASARELVADGAKVLVTGRDETRTAQ
ncbi:SDR family NAD(P)-dependent oxidoreductase, partial [Streptomyces virginiae]